MTGDHDRVPAPDERDRTVRRLLELDTLTDARGVLLREMIDAARDEAAIPADDTDEG
jgi:hypothetical protein